MLAYFTPHRVESLARSRGCLTCTHFLGRFYAEHLDAKVSSMQSEDDFSKGMQTIERLIIEGVWAAGRNLTTADFTWHRGQAVMPRPEAIDLRVRLGRRAAIGIFSREEIEDSAERVERPGTLRTIQRIIAEAGQMPR